MTDRKQVTEYELVLSGTWDTQDIEKLIHKLKHLRSQGYSKVELDEKYYSYSEESRPVLNAIKYRKENDKEYAARIESENRQKEARRMEYERLRKEFEDPNVTKALLFQVANEHEITDN